MLKLAHLSKIDCYKKKKEGGLLLYFQLFELLQASVLVVRLE